MFAIHIAFTFLLFFIFVTFSFYVPGALAIDFANPKIGKGERFISSWTVGISLFLLGIYIFSWLNFWYGYLFILAILAIYAFFKKREIFYFKKETIDIKILLLIIIGSLFFLGLTFKSGIFLKDGFQLVGVTNSTDGLMHLAFIKNMLTTFPPVHAGLANVPLRGYHYFYDLLLSRFVLYYHFSPEDLHYRLFPFFMSLIYGSGFYLFSITNRF